jgi:hypothetical protein
MNPYEVALTHLWRSRSDAYRPYLLLNDPRGYLDCGSTAATICIDGRHISVHICANECALRGITEGEREQASFTNRIIVSRMQLEPDQLPDVQSKSSSLSRALTATEIAKALGVENPRPMLERLPTTVFWGLAPFLSFLNTYSFERVLLASLLGDSTVLAAAWSPDQVLDNLWYEGCLARLHGVLDAVEPDEKRILEGEFLSLVKPWLGPARRAVIEVAVLEERPPPVLPLCLLGSILEGWNSLTPAMLRKFLEGSDLGDLFVDVLQDGNNLAGLAEWGRRIAFRADENCFKAITYLDSEVFPRKPEALTEALAVVVSAVGGNGEQRLVSQLVRLLEADGGLLAQGLCVTLRQLLGIAALSAVEKLPLEHAPIDLRDRLDSADAEGWQKLLELLRRHQARERYEDHVALLEAMITLHRLTGKAQQAAAQTRTLDWKGWQAVVDSIYLPLSAQMAEARNVSGKLSGNYDVSKVVGRANTAMASIAADYTKFYAAPMTGLPQWIRDKAYQAGTSRPWLNSDVVEMAVKPLLRDPGLDQVYLIVFDGMSVTNWTMLRDRFLMAKGRELFRAYNGHTAEYRAFTYLPSITHLCRRAIFAGDTPFVFNHWVNPADEGALLDRCLHNLACKPTGWNPARHYFCYNEKSADPETLRRDLRTLIDTPAKLKAIVFNLQDRLLDKSGISSLQEIMLTYVREVALPFLRRIANQPKAALVITADHGFTQYDKKWVIEDLKVNNPGREVFIHNRCLEYKKATRTTNGPPGGIRIDDPVAFGMPQDWTGADLVTGPDSYGWPGGKERASGNPHPVRGHDHGGLTPEETVVPIAIYVTRK